MSLFSGRRPRNLGVSGEKLAPCPPSPNCVCSDATDRSHRVEPFELALEPREAWQAARAAVSALPRTRIVTESRDYLHAECRSPLLGFVDDLELHLRPAQRLLAVRSASRVGYSDLGVNRRRVEELREALRSAGAIR
jgi:uncharacterized protein (DUF1499 family)